MPIDAIIGRSLLILVVPSSVANCRIIGNSSVTELGKSFLCLGQLLLSGASQQGLQCGRYTRPPEAASVVMRQTQRAAAGIQTFSGSVSSLRVWLGPVTTPDCQPSVGESGSLFRVPDAGNLPVRFDERLQRC